MRLFDLKTMKKHKIATNLQFMFDCFTLMVAQYVHKYRLENMNNDTNNTQQFWNELYEKRDQIWSGRANAPLIDAVASLKPGTALDLGCGEGGDAVWLALQGWQVTATDVSDVAIKRSKALAKEHGVEDKITFEQHDLTVSFPAGEYDLVSAQYLQSPIEFKRHEVLQKAASVVAVSGILVIVEHASAPSWSDHKDMKFPTVQETFDSLQLDSTKWQVEKLATPKRETASPDGEPATIKDNVIIVKLTRI